MKLSKIYYLSCVLCCCLLFGFCERAELLSKEDYSLVSPNGIALAQDLSQLKSYISEEVIAKYGTGTDFDIVKIEYAESAVSSAGLITYQTNGGMRDQAIVISNYDKASTDTPLTEQDGGCEKTVIICSGDSCCTLNGSIDLDTNDLTYACNCRDNAGNCTLEIKKVKTCEK